MYVDIYVLYIASRAPAIPCITFRSLSLTLMESNEIVIVSDFVMSASVLTRRLVQDEVRTS